MKALVGTFNQEKALVGAFSVIVQPVVEPMDRFAALKVTDPPLQLQLQLHNCHMTAPRETVATLYWFYRKYFAEDLSPK